MNNKLLHNLLALDSLYSLLNVGERISLHRKALGKPTTLTNKVKFWLMWLDKIEWEAPLMRYGQDRLAYYLDDDTLRWILTEEFPNRYEELTYQIQVLKNDAESIKHYKI